MRFTTRALMTLWCLICASRVYAQTLYDGADNTTPDQSPWNWSYAQSPSTPNVTGTASNGATVLDTTSAIGLKGGYARFAPQALDNAAGYTISFNLQVVSETHNRADRAGCDVIVLGSDHKGVELAFWTNEVWAQTDSFTHAIGSEAHAFDTSAGPVDYTLHVAANAYTLSAGTTTLLSGSLHQYPALPGTPYSLPNFLFIGDDTSSASASFRLASVAVVPGPDGAAVFCGGGIILFTALWRRKLPTMRV